jgi:uncharacterized protein (TIGR02246 family)
MSTDEQQIHELVSTWMSATKAGDLATVLTLMTDDVVFLQPGRPPLCGKAAYAAAAEGQKPGLQFDGRSEIQELRVSDDWAWMWTKLTVIATLTDNDEPIRRSGHTLTVLRREHGRWLLARDANLLGQPEGG